jgi:hypothetical protein
MFQIKSTKSIFVVAGILLLLAVVFPMTTSLGQGVDPHVVVGWQGVYNPQSHTYRFRVNYQDGTYDESPMKPLPVAAFSQHKADGLWLTGLNDVAALKSGYEQSPGDIANDFGTHRNVPSLFAPFAQKPIAFSKSFVESLAALKLNLKDFGGPNIVPGSVPVAKLKNDILQIDTLADGNTLHQCEPGQTPAALVQLEKQSS